MSPLILAFFLYFQLPMPQVPFEGMSLKNGCLVNAVIFQDEYNAKFALEKHHWCRVIGVLMSEKGSKKVLGHAMTVFSYKSDLFVFESNYGSIMLCKSSKKLMNDPVAIANVWILMTGDHYILRGVSFLK